MIKCAEEGKISGSINLDIETDVYLELERLFEIQGFLVDVDDIKRYTYKWLIEEVKKINFFSGIEIRLDSDDNILEFHWYL